MMMLMMMMMMMMEMNLIMMLMMRGCQKMRFVHIFRLATRSLGCNIVDSGDDADDDGKSGGEFEVGNCFAGERGVWLLSQWGYKNPCYVQRTWMDYRCISAVGKSKNNDSVDCGDADETHGEDVVDEVNDGHGDSDTAKCADSDEDYCTENEVETENDDGGENQTVGKVTTQHE
jgi:hypothetical protein